MFDLHRHDTFSLFDGFGSAEELAALAKEYGYTALGLTNHGNTSGLYKHYSACKAQGLKPVLGVEGYFLPVYAEQQRGFHLILLCKNLQGWKNLNVLQTEGEKRRYFNPIWDFNLIANHSEGLICCSACVAGYAAQAIKNGELQKAKRFLLKMKQIFGADFYVELQPYKIDEEGTQERINEALVKLARETGNKLILTSDSHYGCKEDFESYLKMHEIEGHDLQWVKDTYAERYMPIRSELVNRFRWMHNRSLGVAECAMVAQQCELNLLEIEEKIEGDFLSALTLQMPKVAGEADSEAALKAALKEGLKRRELFTPGISKNPLYLQRLRSEFAVVKKNGFADYFLIVRDYVKHAKSEGIWVGPGRGSVCNSLLAYILGITEVDSLALGLDFRRFLREDKTTIPDIDLDFETERRAEIIEYLTKKYAGSSARICSYGLYKADNCINDLAGVCKLPTVGDIDGELKRQNLRILSEIKHFVKSFINDDGDLDLAGLVADRCYKDYNRRYDNIILHFTKLYKKVKFIGTHAAGVAITAAEILQYTALRTDKAGDWFTCFDLLDCEALNLVKFDILGLQTMSGLKDMARMAGEYVDFTKIIEDKRILQEFAEGKTDGIFQFDKPAAKKILQNIAVSTFDDVVAATSMNRPGPLKMKAPERYAENKAKGAAGATGSVENAFIMAYTADTFGVILYQEQIMLICAALGLTWGEADKIVKMAKNEAHKRAGLEELKRSGLDLEHKFLVGCKRKGFTKKFSVELFESILDCYSFNKGHAAGYTLISFAEMYYKVYYPAIYWCIKQRTASDLGQYKTFAKLAYRENCIINFLPHVNYSAPETRLRLEDGEQVIQQGLADILGVGEKAAAAIYAERCKNGIYSDYDNFFDRVKATGERAITSRVIELLKDCGALEFDKEAYINRIIKYASSMHAGKG